MPIETLQLSSDRIRPVIVFTTGGTIEKSYSEEDGTLSNRTSLLREVFLPTLRLPKTRLEFIEIMAKDSLEMTDDDRKVILDAVKSKLELGCPILILHGTDTMELTGHYLEKNLQPPENLSQKTSDENNETLIESQQSKPLSVPIMLTGAMRPLTMLNSDAPQNFTEALTAVQLVPPGVYISFHNQVLKVPHATKNHSLKTFEEKTIGADIRFPVLTKN